MIRFSTSVTDLKKLPETADKPISLLEAGLKAAAPMTQIHGWAKDPYWGDKIVENRIIGYITINADDLAELRWSEIFQPIAEIGCTDFHASLTLYDAQGVWAGYELTGQPDHLGPQLELGEIDPSDLRLRRHNLTIGLSLPLK